MEHKGDGFPMTKTPAPYDVGGDRISRPKKTSFESQLSSLPLFDAKLDRIAETTERQALTIERQSLAIERLALMLDRVLPREG